MRILLFLLFAVAAYIAAYFLFSVNYAGIRTLYASRLTNLLFPWAHTLWPAWGHNRLGMMNANPTRYGQGAYWPASKTEDTMGSAGIHPDGGLRTPSYPHAVSLRRGYDSLPEPRVVVDHSGIPAPSTLSVGWWGY